MPRGKKELAEQIIPKLREVEVEVGRGKTVVEAVKKIGVTEQTYYRWKKQYGGLRIDQAKRLKDLEKENSRLKQLSLAAPNMTLTNELPRPLNCFRQEYPDVELRLIDRGSAACIELVEKGEVDMAVAGRLDENPLPTLRTERLARYPFMFICRNDHGLADAARLSLKTIARHPFVIPGAGTNARRRFDEVFTAAGLRAGLRVVMEANTKELLLDYVQMGFGVAVVSMSPVAMKRFAGDGSRQIVFHDLSRLFGHENIELFIRRARFQPPHEKAFCDLVIEACAGA